MPFRPQSSENFKDSEYTREIPLVVCLNAPLPPGSAQPLSRSCCCCTAQSRVMAYLGLLIMFFHLPVTAVLLKADSHGPLGLFSVFFHLMFQLTCSTIYLLATMTKALERYLLGICCLVCTINTCVPYKTIQGTTEASLLLYYLHSVGASGP